MPFTVERIHRNLKKGKYAKGIRREASVFLTASLEYVCAEVIALAGQAAKANKRARITPHHILMAISSDGELNRLVKNVTVRNGGVMPQILSELRPARKPKRKRKQPRRKPEVNNAPAGQMEPATHDGQMDSATHDDGQMDSATHDGQMDSATHDGQMDSDTHDGQMDSATHDGQMDSDTHDSKMDTVTHPDAATGTIEAPRENELM